MIKKQNNKITVYFLCLLNIYVLACASLLRNFPLNFSGLCCFAEAFQCFVCVCVCLGVQIRVSLHMHEEGGVR